MTTDTQQKEFLVERKEFLVDPQLSRLTITPIVYQDVWKMYKVHEAAMWHANEIKPEKDLNDWAKLNDNQKHFIKMVLGFFATSDLIVNENLSQRFMREITMTEARTFYAFQMMMENIHSEVYSNFIETYISDKDERKHILESVKHVSSISKKAAWAKKWIDSDNPLSERIVAFSIVEGIFFSGAFCSIYWLVEKGLMPSLAKGNDFISRDEGLHMAFAVLLYTKYIVNRMTQERFNEILIEAVALEIEFINEALPCRLIGMNNSDMSIYIKYVADRLAKMLGYSPIYNCQNPFDFMVRISLKNKSNFFEETPTEYTTTNPTGNDTDMYADFQ